MLTSLKVLYSFRSQNDDWILFWQGKGQSFGLFVEWITVVSCLVKLRVIEDIDVDYVGDLVKYDGLIVDDTKVWSQKFVNNVNVRYREINRFAFIGAI